MCTLCLGNITQACSIASPAFNAEEVVATSDVVFAGIVKKTKASEKLNTRGGTFRSKIEVFKLYKGWVPSDEVTIQGVSDDCVHNFRVFEEGKLLILFAYYRTDGELDIPTHFSQVRQNSLVSYLEKGKGRHKMIECMRDALEDAHEIPAISSSKSEKGVYGCFKRDTTKEDPFRFIPPEQ